VPIIDFVIVVAADSFPAFYRPKKLIVVDHPFPFRALPVWMGDRIIGEQKAAKIPASHAQEA
jgi:hypothetical protein